MKDCTKFQDLGYIHINALSLFTGQELETINRVLESIPLEEVSVGDTSEKSNMEVGRLLVDYPGELPRVTNSELCRPVINILESNDKINFFRSLAPKAKCLRRAQFNIMNEGSFLDIHLDCESNPDYLLAVSLQLEESYEGGEFIIHNKNNNKVKLKQFEVCISSCKINHEVTKVLSGKRVTLVCFLSSNMRENSRNVVS